MKKKHLIPLSILLIILIIIGVSFVKIPLEIISKERIMHETKGNLELNSYSKQYLQLLPNPHLTLIDAKFTMPKYDLLVSSDKIDIHRSLFSNQQYEILMDYGSINESKIKNIKLKISSDDNSLIINSNNFGLDNSSIQIETILKDNFLEFMKFNLDNLDISNNKLFNKIINFNLFKDTFISVDGIYKNNQISINSANLNLGENTKINFKGIIDLKNTFLSSLDIIIENLNTNTLRRLLGSYYQNSDLYDYLPEGIFETVNLKLKENQIIINSADFIISKESSVKLNGHIDLLEPSLSSINIEISEIQVNLLKEIFQVNPTITQYLNFIPNGKFKKINLEIKNNLFDVKEIDLTTINNNNLKINSLGPIKNLSNPNLELKININEASELEEYFKLFDLKDEQEIFEYIDLNNAFFDIMINDKIIQIRKLEIYSNDKETISLIGDYSLNSKDFDDVILNINNLSKDKFKNLISLFTSLDFEQYFEIVEFKDLNLEAIINIKNNIALIKNLELINNENISKIEGIIKDGTFKGNLNLKKINIKKIDDYFIKSKRLKGYIDIFIETDNPINIGNITNLNGNFNGTINVILSNEEKVLIDFIQSLTTNVEDLKFVNQVSKKLVNLYANKPIKITGEISNLNKDEYEINNLILKSSEEEYIKSNLKISEKNLELVLFDIFNDEDFLLAKKNNNYSFQRKNKNGIIELNSKDIIEKNITKIFENLLN